MFGFRVLNFRNAKVGSSILLRSTTSFLASSSAASISISSCALIPTSFAIALAALQLGIASHFRYLSIFRCGIPNRFATLFMLLSLNTLAINSW